MCSGCTYLCRVLGRPSPVSCTGEALTCVVYWGGPYLCRVLGRPLPVSCTGKALTCVVPWGCSYLCRALGRPSPVTCPHLCQHCVVLFRPVHLASDSCVLSDLEVKVDDLVREGWELVAEAEPVLALHRRRPRKAVVLLARVLVQLLAIRSKQLHVDIVVSPRDNLPTKANSLSLKTQKTYIITSD